MGCPISKPKYSKFKHVEEGGDYTRNTHSEASKKSIGDKVERLVRCQDLVNFTYEDIAENISDECKDMGLTVVVASRRELGPLNRMYIKHICGTSNTRLQANVFIANDYVFVTE